jgi:hypothetical protein
MWVDAAGVGPCYKIPMRAANRRIVIWLLLLVLALLLVAQRPPFAPEGFAWNPFGKARHSFAHSACGIPIHFRLGEMDPRFGVDQATAMTALVEAGSLWQAMSGKVLFLESDHPVAMSVSFLYDQRQQAANLRRSLRGSLDHDRRQLASDEALLSQWSDRVRVATEAYERAGERFRHRADQYESQVRSWNDGTGDRSEARRQRLAEEGAALKLAAEELGRELEALNADISALNRRVDDVRQRAGDVKARVAAYNAAGAEAPVESGRYSYDRAQGRRIAVFRAEGYNDLVWILAHELGHALGIEHVDQPGAIMHPTLHEDGELQRGSARPVALAEADRAALATVCGSRL